MITDLRSDTVTKPSSAMLHAMMQAKVGDDVFGEDPTVKLLETTVAKIFGKDEALFFPSGTMANQTALKLHTNPGEQVICDKYAHVYNYESGGASFNSGISCRLIDGDRGMFNADQAKLAINPSDYWYAKTSLIEIENTTNKGGGACWDLKEIRKIKNVCDENGLRFHLDGARLWNALVAKNEEAKDYGNLFDTISVCLSKGLGCPIGSLLIGDHHIMENAIRIRKTFGGNMRQAGYLAAAGIYALEHNIERLAQDHERAKEIGDVLKSVSQVKKVEPIETNIIIFELNKDINDAQFVASLKEKGIYIIGMGGGKLRMVTHLDYTSKMHDHLIKVLKNF